MVLSPKGEDKYEMKYVPEDFDRYDQGFFGRAKPEYIIVKGECLEKLKQQGYEMDCWQKGIPFEHTSSHIYQWDACSGYYYADSTINGFSHTHLSGTGCGDYGDVLLMPTVGRQDYHAMGEESQQNGLCSFSRE